MHGYYPLLLAGMKVYMERYGATMKRVMSTFNGTFDWSVEGCSKITEQMEQLVPLDKLEVSIPYF